MDNNNDVVLWDSEALYYVNGATTAAAANGSDVTSSSSSSDFTTERTDGCLPMSEWQVKSFPNCNSFHETDFGRSVRDGELSVLGRGWFRTTWQYGPPGAPIPLVLKTLRMEREFLPEYYELHRRDATAMERLTWSEFVVDIYGYCAQSVVNEMADFPSPDVRDLEKLNRRLRRKKGPEIDKIKLQLAASVAQGVTDIHSIDGPGRATMVHYDLNPRNIALFSGARPKINDFNIAEFLTYDPATNATCGFENRMHQPWWRAPEEVDPNRTVLLDEKVDAYALCNILFSIYTTHAPRGKMKDYRMEGVRELVAAGIPPDLPPPYNETKTSITDVFTKIFSRCYAKDPKERASSQEITDILVNAIYDRIQKSQGKKGGSGKKKEPSLTNLKKEPEAAASNPDAEAVAADVVAEASPSDDDSSDTTEDAKERTR
jgi:serine/threonine protein kinase